MKNGEKEALGVVQFVIWMIMFIGMMLGFFYWAYGTLDSRIMRIEGEHIDGQQRLTKLETLMDVELPNIKNGLLKIENKLDAMLKNYSITVKR